MGEGVNFLQGLHIFMDLLGGAQKYYFTNYAYIIWNSEYNLYIIALYPSKNLS